MSKLWQQVVSDSGPPKLAEVDLDTLHVTRPTIVFLPGIFAKDEALKITMNCIIRLKRTLAGNPDLQTMPDIYSWSHGGMSESFNLAAYDLNPSRASSKNGRELSRSLIMPLVAKDFSIAEDGAVSGTPLPLDEARKNIRNLSFITYSAGGIIAQQLYNASYKMMKNIGYSEEDTRDVLKEVVLVTVGAFSRPEKETKRFTTISLASTKDIMARARDWVFDAPKKLMRALFCDSSKNKSLKLNQLSDTSLVVEAPVRPTFFEWKYDENGEPVEKKPFKPLLPRWTGIRSYHELPHYFTRDENNNPFANIISTVLTNAVNRADYMSPVRLLESAAAAPKYRQKVAAAVKDMQMANNAQA